MSTSQTAKKDITLEEAMQMAEGHSGGFIKHHAPHLQDVRTKLVPSHDLSMLYVNVGSLRDPLKRVWIETMIRSVNAYYNDLLKEYNLLK